MPPLSDERSGRSGYETSGCSCNKVSCFQRGSLSNAPRHRAKASGFLVYSSLTLIRLWVVNSQTQPRHRHEPGKDHEAPSPSSVTVRLLSFCTQLFVLPGVDFPNPIIMQIKWCKHSNEVAVIMLFMIKDMQVLLSKVVFNFCTLESGNGPV